MLRLFWLGRILIIDSKAIVCVYGFQSAPQISRCLLPSLSVAIRAVAFTDRNEEGLVTFVRFYTENTPVFA